MRFVSYILCAGLMCAPILGSGFQLAHSQAQDSSPKPASKVPQVKNQTTYQANDQANNLANYIDLTIPPKTPRARLQKGQRINTLKTLDGLEIKRFARRLGEISSIARGAEGQLYVTDPHSGRVFIVPDRDQNGRPEQIRPLPYRFNAPSAAIELGGYLYIADREALWKMPKARISAEKPIKLASLQNTQSTGPYFLAAQGSSAPQDTAQLTLGYTAQTGKVRLLSIDTQTGRATLQDETDGTQLRLAAPSRPRDIVSRASNESAADLSSSTKPWAAYQTQDGLRIGAGLNNPAVFSPAAAIAGLALPHSDNLPDNWPKALHDHIFISQVNPVSVSALPTSLGTVLPRGREVFSGFQNSRTAWGHPGVLHIDKRGLFVADPFNGDLWLIRPKPTKADLEKRNRVNAALTRLKTASEQAEIPLKRDPLQSIQDSRFPVSNGPSKSSDSNLDTSKADALRSPPSDP